jgi:rhomboid protease GluP
MAKCIQCGRQLPALTFGKKVCRWCVQHEAAQRGEEDTMQRVETAPWLRRESSSMMVTQAFFAINVIVFVAMAFAGVSLTEPTGQDLIRWGANFGPRTLAGQWWRLLSCVFLHIGIIHIAFNMWCLWDLGALAESLYGHWTFAAVYLTTGVASSVTSSAWHPGGVSAGASGAIFGIAGALIASFYLGEFSLPRAAISGTLRSVVMFAGYNLVFGALWGRTDNAAHIGGLVSGLTLGALIARVAPDRDLVRRGGVLLFGFALVGLGVFWLQHSRSYLVHAQAGQTLLMQRKNDQAIAEFQTALRQRPDFVPARFELARAYLFKNDLDHAQTELQRVIAATPKDEGAYYYLGYIYLEKKQAQQALGIFEQLLQLNPNSPDGHAGRAAVFSFENKYSEALEEYKLAANLDPDYRNVYYDMGVVQAKLNQYDDAITSFVKQRDNGDDPDNEKELARAYEARGMKAEAAEARQKAAELKN